MELKDAETTARFLMKAWLPYQDYGMWKFKFDNAKRRFGSCNFMDKTITLSKPLTLLNDRAQVEDTILHEIAHARVGPSVDAHGAAWKQEARHVGATPKACYGNDVASPEPNYIGTCPHCGKVVARRYRMRQEAYGYYHTTCPERYLGQAPLIWTRVGASVAARKPKKTTWEDMPTVEEL